jgi:hypothetical protein
MRNHTGGGGRVAGVLAPALASAAVAGQVATASGQFPVVSAG